MSSLLSCSPRYDQFKINLPKDFLPEEVTAKWQKFFSKDSSVFTTPIDYLNESIKGITIPGITDLTITQPQHSSNPITRTSRRINVEPKQDNATYGVSNPLDRIDREFKISFRMNQGLYNYFMLYEAIFYRVCKHELYKKGTDLYIDMLNEDGAIAARLYLYQCHIKGIDGLDLSFDKVERQSDSFDITLTFNNLDYEFLDEVEL